VVVAGLVAAAAAEPERAGGRDSLFSGAIDRPMTRAALRLSRRRIAAGTAVLALLGGFVFVRAVMIPRGKASSLVQVVSPAPVPASDLAAPTPEVETFPMVGPTYQPSPPSAPNEPAAVTTAMTTPEGGSRPPRAGRSGPATLSPAQARELLRTGQTMLKAQRYQEATEAFKRLLAGRRERGMALVGLGNIAFQQKSYADALGRAKDAVKARGGVDARLLLADVYYKLEKFDEAKKAYDAALKLDPTNETARRGFEVASKRLN
jgi:hypothetical protein